MTVGVAGKGDGLRRKEGSGNDALGKVFWVPFFQKRDCFLPCNAFGQAMLRQQDSAQEPFDKKNNVPSVPTNPPSTLRATPPAGLPGAPLGVNLRPDRTA
jgi:hypothetical protein